MKGTRGPVFGFMLLAGLMLAGALSVVAQSPPSAPTTLNSATAVSACAVTLQWNQSESSPAASFELSVNNSTPFQAGTLSGHGQFSFTDSFLTPERNYSYKVRAVPAIGNPSAFSNVESETTPAITAPPVAPSALQVTAWEKSVGRPVLTWTPSDPNRENSGFRIFRSDDGGITFPAIATITLPQFKTGVLVNNTRVPNTWNDSNASSDALRIYRIKTYQTAASCEAVTDSTSDTTPPPFVKFSAISSDLIVPARPASVSVIDTRDNHTKAKFGWDNVEGEDVFGFQLSDAQEFSDILKDRTYPRNATESTATGDEPAGFFTFPSGGTFYYRIRACAAESCSDYRVGATPHVSALVGPRDLTASAAPRSATAADVSLNWKDTAGHLHKTRVYRKPGPNSEVDFTRIGTELPGQGCTPLRCESYPTSHIDPNLALGDRTYEYRVVFVNVADGVEGELSNTVSVNMDLTFLDQWGWSGGFGWIRAAYNAVKSAWGVSTEPADDYFYGVAMDNDTGKLSGYAWNDSGGWLSFNTSDLLGCPSITCEAGVNLRTGQVNGWARFTAADPTKGAWTGWVSLSSKSGEPAYGLYYATTTQGTATIGQFRGFAWGGDVTGWVSFGGPILRKVTPLPGGTSAEVEWENPVDYGRVEIYRSLPGQPNADPLTFDLLPNQAATTPGVHTEIVSGLTTNTEYSFFVRGYAQ